MAPRLTQRLRGAPLCALAFGLVVAVFALSGCGDDDDDAASTVNSPGVSETTPAETETQDAARPSGVLTTDGVGSVEEGMGVGDVSSYFGPPTENRVEPGCELGGPSAPKVLVARYALDDGTLTLFFNASGERLRSYRTDSASFESERGDRVGDSFAEVQGRWGDRLEPVPLGQVTEKLGFWWVSDGPTRHLLFDIRKGKVAEIQGGDIQFCE